MQENVYPTEFVSFKRKENLGFSYYYHLSLPAVHTYIKARFRFSDEDCEDVIQEVFVRLFRVIDGIHDPGHILPFLMTSARNACIDRLRRDKTQTNRENMIREVMGMAINPDDHDLVKAEVLATVRVYLHLLSDKNRVAFKMHYFEGYNLAEIAAVMGIEEKTVSYHLQTAVNILRPHLKELLLCAVLVGAWGYWEA